MHMSHMAQKALHKEKEEYGWRNGNMQNHGQKKETGCGYKLSY